MGILSYTYNAAKAALKGKGKVSPTITSFKPNVPKTKLEKSKSGLAIQTQKTKASGAKLKQTLFESKNKAFKGDDFTFSPSKAGKGKQPRDKRMGGGFMGRRMGYSKGTPKPKTNVDKIKKAFPAKTKIKFDAKKSDLDKSGDLSKYEKARGMAIAKAMAKRNKKV